MAPPGVSMRLHDRSEARTLFREPLNESALAYDFLAEIVGSSGMKQTTFDGLAFVAKKKQTRREKFLAQMDAVVPGAALVAVIAPPYPKAGRRGTSA